MSGIDIDEFDDYTGRPSRHYVYTAELRELAEDGIFKWDGDLDWSEYAYSPEQYARVCDYFEQRFWYREISVIPYKRWALMVGSRIKYELCPKYNPLYEALDKSDIFETEGRYYKRRLIDSEYPETLLSGNSDYVSTGHDEEYEELKKGDMLDKTDKYREVFEPLDKAFLDELETFFISLYTADISGF